MRIFTLIFAAVLVACTFSPQKTDIPFESPVAQVPAIETEEPKEHKEREKSGKAPLKRHTPPVPELPDPCVGIDTETLKDDIHAKLDCMIGNPK